MNSNLFRLYQMLPAGLQSMGASAAGLRLRFRRYGPGFQNKVAEIEARNDWDRDRWTQYQATVLTSVLQRAISSVPYYRRVADRCTLRTCDEPLQSWPTLEKDEVRKAPRDFVADDRSPLRLVKVHTSGTTGKPLTIYRSADTEQMWYAMYEVRARIPWDISWRDRWAILGGRIVVAKERKRPPFWTLNRGLNQLYLSSYHLSRENAMAYFDAIADFDAAYFHAYTSAVYTLAQYALDLGRSDIRPRVIMTNGEPLFRHQRDTISRAFDCPVVETYGMTEMCVSACECREGNLHYWPDLGILEILGDDGSPLSPGETGHVVCTTLLNSDQPLIRYRTGDMAAILPPSFACPCGDTKPCIARIEGRSDDIVVTSDGRRIGRLDPVFKADLRIREAQIIQEAPDQFVIRYVPIGEVSGVDTRTMRRELEARVGRCKVRFDPVTEIPRTEGGKFRAVISNYDRSL